jgi:hypothetical protein
VCKAAGTCGSLTVPKFDDGNPCTLDKCDPTLGIVHTTVADGSWCDDGVACTEGDSCITGTCIGGPRLFAKNFSGRTLYHMEPVTAGGFVLCGSTNDAIGSAYLTWVDAAGKQKYDNLALGTAAYPGRGCAQASDDAIWQAGWSGAGNPAGARVRKVDLATKTVVFDKSYAGVQFSSIVAHPNGGVLALGSDQPNARVTRLLANGDVAWDWYASGVGDADNANDAVVLSDGSIIVVGEKHAAGAASTPFAVRLAADGSLLWTAAFAVSTGRLLGVALRQDGTVTAVGGQGQGIGAGAWIVRFDTATGAVVDNFTPGSPQGTVWYDVVFIPPSGVGASPGSAILAGGSPTQAFVARVGQETFGGKPQTLALGAQGTNPAYRSVVLDPSGDFVVAGNLAQAQLVRTDAWFHTTCASAGKCLSVLPTQCDDQNACTSDECDGTLGCTYVPASPNQPCPGGTCQGTVCK